MKLCRACNENKPESSFSKSSRAKNGLQTYCKPCQVRMDTANPNRGARYARYKAKFPARVTWSSIKKRAERLGVPVLGMEDFALWLEQQPRCCEYCGMPEAEAKNQFGKRLHVDRKDGTLGYIRGNLVLACHRCNVVKNGYLTHAQMMQVAGMFFGGPVNNHEAMVRELEEQQEWLAGKATSSFLNGFPADDEAHDRIESINRVLTAVVGKAQEP